MTRFDEWEDRELAAFEANDRGDCPHCHAALIANVEPLTDDEHAHQRCHDDYHATVGSEAAEVMDLDYLGTARSEMSDRHEWSWAERIGSAL